MNGTETTTVEVAFPEVKNLHLRIRVGACRLKINPGDGPAWVSGTYRDPSGTLPLTVLQRGGELEITQDQKWAEMPSRLSRFPAELQLALGKAKTYTVTLETGASEADLDFGGLPISKMIIRQGAGKISVDFSAPNPVAMDTLSLSGGASNIAMENLANANFADMRVEGGAAAYFLDFGGRLQRDSAARITAAVSSVEVRLPASTAAQVTTESFLGGVDIGDGFTKKEGAFQTQAALAGQGPRLTIHANVTMGSLRLRQS